MLLSLRKNGLTSLSKKVKVFKDSVDGQAVLQSKVSQTRAANQERVDIEKFPLKALNVPGSFA